MRRPVIFAAGLFLAVGASFAVAAAAYASESDGWWDQNDVVRSDSNGVYQIVNRNVSGSDAYTRSYSEVHGLLDVVLGYPEPDGEPTGQPTGTNTATASFTD
ncbi:hypothetical protein HH310_40270 [Actinoplanes sp. TBRC 11911]|uniref:hypothetical protein n=1 Tax=Actinoplanes sp. TBRC 11911 TaxID=2729386 RepID=UPI00145E2273|nr:hypothetical protein [Actinoplanes sp. TBRC 11911]NMO57395.1 hypothetical protein [Actinoplanes sp. TBRC 11911]